MNRFLSLALAALLLAPCVSAADLPASAAPSGPETAAASAVLMEKESGAVLYEKDARQKLQALNIRQGCPALPIAHRLTRRKYRLGKLRLGQACLLAMLAYVRAHARVLHSRYLPGNVLDENLRHGYTPAMAP